MPTAVSPDSDNPETPEHLDELRRLVFEGKYTEAQALCNRYMVCRGSGDRVADAAFGSYQTAGGLYVTLPEGKDGRVVHCRIEGAEGKTFRVRVNGQMMDGKENMDWME